MSTSSRTGAYDDAGPVVADLGAITEAVVKRDAAGAAAAVEAYLRASALRMVECYLLGEPSSGMDRDKP